MTWFRHSGGSHPHTDTLFVPLVQLICDTALCACRSQRNRGTGIIPGQMSVIFRNGCQDSVCCRRQSWVCCVCSDGLPVLRDDVKYQSGSISAALAGYTCESMAKVIPLQGDVLFYCCHDTRGRIDAAPSTPISAVMNFADEHQRVSVSVQLVKWIHGDRDDGRYEGV